MIHLQNITQMSIKLHAFSPNRLIDVARNLRNLEKTEILRYRKWLSIDLITQVLQYADKLSELHIRGDVAYRIDESVYNEILRVLSAREQCSKLTMTFEYISITNHRYNWNYSRFAVWGEHPNLTINMVAPQPTRLRW